MNRRELIKGLGWSAAGPAFFTAQAEAITHQRYLTLLGGAGVPGWVMRGPTGLPALLDIDYANGLQWWNGVPYPSLASLLAASGGIQSGITNLWTSGYIGANAELIANPVPVDLTGWSNINSGLSSVVANELVLDGNGGTNPSVEQSFASTLSLAYKVGATYRRGTSASGAIVLAGVATNLSNGLGLGNNNTTSDVTNSGIFGAEGATSYLGLRIPAAGATGTVIGHNFSAKQCLPFAGFAPFETSGIISGVTPSGTAANAVLWQFGSSAERNRLRLVYDTTGHLHFIATYAGSAAADIDLGAVSTSTSFSVQFTAATNRFAARLNTNTTISDSVGQCPPLGYGYIGRSFTGETWTGTISRVTMFNTERLPSDMILLNGDSYPAGAGGVSLTASLATASGRADFNIGVGGTTISQQLTVLQANQDLTSAICVQWDGDYNGFGNITDDMAIYAQMVSTYRTSRYAIIPPCRRANESASQLTATSNLQAALASAYPNNCYDAQAFLKTLAVSPGDDFDVAHDYIPTSCLQGDGTHLTLTAMNALAVDLWSWMGTHGLQ